MGIETFTSNIEEDKRYGEVGDEQLISSFLLIEFL
jgi:hypothetical protein